MIDYLACFVAGVFVGVLVVHLLVRRQVAAIRASRRELDAAIADHLEWLRERSSTSSAS